MKGGVGCCVFSLSSYIYLGDGVMLSRTDLLFWGRYARDQLIRNFRPKFWPFDCEYLVNGKSQRYMSIRA